MWPTANAWPYQSLSHARSSNHVLRQCIRSIVVHVRVSGLLSDQAAMRPIPISRRRWPGGNTCHAPSAWRKKKSENDPVGRST